MANRLFVEANCRVPMGVVSRVVGLPTVGCSLLIHGGGGAFKQGGLQTYLSPTPSVSCPWDGCSACQKAVKSDSVCSAVVLGWGKPGGGWCGLELAWEEEAADHARDSG